MIALAAAAMTVIAMTVMTVMTAMIVIVNKRRRKSAVRRDAVRDNAAVRVRIAAVSPKSVRSNLCL